MFDSFRQVGAVHIVDSFSLIHIHSEYTALSLFTIHSRGSVLASGWRFILGSAVLYPFTIHSATPALLNKAIHSLDAVPYAYLRFNPDNRYYPFFRFIR